MNGVGGGASALHKDDNLLLIDGEERGGGGRKKNRKRGCNRLQSWRMYSRSIYGWMDDRGMRRG